MVRFGGGGGKKGIGKPVDAAPPAEVNPLKSDPELKGLLRRLKKVNKYKTFDRWKTKFLKRMETFLYEKGIKPSEDTVADFSKLLKKGVKSANKVTGFIEKGELSNQKKTVKGRLALNELANVLVTVNEELEHLIPSTGKDEKKQGYSKYHLGATLIRQGFHQYITLNAIDDAITEIRERVADIADRQQLDLLKSFSVRNKRFADIMADLGMYEICKKCIQFANAPEEEESTDEEPMMIEIEIDNPLDDENKTIMKLEVEPSDKMSDIRAVVAEDTGISPEKIQIKFKGKQCDNDNATLASVGIKDGSKLSAGSIKIPITVYTSSGDEIKLMVEPTKYLTDIKLQLESKTNIPAKNQKLTNITDRNNKVPLDSNVKKIADLGIKSGSILYLEPKLITIMIQMPDGKTIKEIEVSPSVDTTESVKKKIADLTGMSVPQQKCMFQKEEMPKGKLLNDIGIINNGDTIVLELNKVPVTINVKGGKKLTIMVDPTDDIATIKKQIEKETGLKPGNQNLSNKKTPITNDKNTAESYDIESGTVLTLDPASITIKITMPDGETQHEFQITAFDDTTDIEAKISNNDFISVNNGGGKVQINYDKIFK